MDGYNIQCFISCQAKEQYKTEKCAKRLGK